MPKYWTVEPPSRGTAINSARSVRFCCRDKIHVHHGRLRTNWYDQLRSNLIVAPSNWREVMKTTDRRSWYKIRNLRRSHQTWAKSSYREDSTAVDQASQRSYGLHARRRGHQRSLPTYASEVTCCKSRDSRASHLASRAHKEMLNCRIQVPYTSLQTQLSLTQNHPSKQSPGNIYSPE